jgi:hypothetical protein
MTQLVAILILVTAILFIIKSINKICSVHQPIHWLVGHLVKFIIIIPILIIITIVLIGYIIETLIDIIK